MAQSLNFDSLHSSIGAVVVAFGHLEAEIADCLRTICDKDNPAVGQIIADKLQFKDSVDVFIKLTALRTGEDPEAEKLLKILSRELSHYAELRNDIIHSAWYGSTESPFTASREAVRRRGGKLPSEFTDTRALHKLCQDMHATRLGIETFRDRFFK